TVVPVEQGSVGENGGTDRGVPRQCPELDRESHAARPNGPRLSCGRVARRRKAVGRQSVPRQGHNTPFPLKRSPPVSFKRLLGGTPVRCADMSHCIRVAASQCSSALPSSKRHISNHVVV